jgi:tRNA/rRNA methyltransferase
MAEMALPLLASNRVAVVFGNEVTGLEFKDLALCHEVVAIPSSEAFPSLNLSHAVMVIAYELYTASNRRNNASNTALATADELENFYHHLQQILQAIGFLDPTARNTDSHSGARRARLDSRDVGILRGVLSEIRGLFTKDHKALIMLKFHYISCIFNIPVDIYLS